MSVENAVMVPEETWLSKTQVAMLRGYIENGLIPDREVALEMGIEALIWFYIKECGEGGEKMALKKFHDTSISLCGQFALAAVCLIRGLDRRFRPPGQGLNSYFIP